MRIAPTPLSLLLSLAFATACGSPTVPTDASSPSSSSPSSSSSSPSSSPSSSSIPKPSHPTTTPESLDTSAGPLVVHPIHHATVWLDAKGKIVWVDPSSEADLSGPKADLVLITHEHHDHFDLAGIDKVKKDGTRIIGPASIAEKVPGLVVMKNGDKRDEGPIGIEAVPSYNNERGPEKGKLFHPKGRDNGYVVSFGGKRVYFSGDTECTDEMKALTSIDLAFVCMNLPYTMPPSEAATCVKAFKPKVLVPYHYRGQNVDELDGLLGGSGVTIHQHDLY